MSEKIPSPPIVPQQPATRPEEDDAADTAAFDAAMKIKDALEPDLDPNKKTRRVRMTLNGIDVSKPEKK